MGRAAPRPLDGRVVAITGGARGIGRATAQGCLRAGMQVAIGDLDIQTAERTVVELGGATIAVELNVCDRSSVKAFLDETEARLGPLDVLVNNAGIMQLSAFLDESDATAQRQVDVNVHGVLHGMKEAIPRMLAHGGGHLVNIASTAGKVGFAGAATYAGTKHFVVGVSEAVRGELRGSPIEISCVMPVIVKTELAAGLPDGRFIKQIEADDVAAAVVEALRKPRFEVFVPRYPVGPLTKFGAILPQRVREAVGRLLQIDRSLAAPDQSVRLAYEQRAATSTAERVRELKP